MRALYLPFSSSSSDSTTTSKFEAGPFLSKLVEETPTCEEEEVLIQVNACNLTMWDKAHLSYMKKLGCSELAVGHEFSGVVHQVGRGVSQWQAGDPVMGIVPIDHNRPACAEYVVVDQYDIVAKPASVSDAHAASCLEDALKAYIALVYQAHIRPADLVFLPRGATGFGSMAVQLAALFGARVITSAHSEDELGYLESLQQDIVVLDCTGGVEGNKLRQMVMDESLDMGVDIIIDQGNVKQPVCDSPEWEAPTAFWTVGLSCSVLSVGGRLVTQQAGLQVEPAVSQRLLQRCASLSFLFGQAWPLGTKTHGRYLHILRDVAEKLRDNAIRPNIHHTVAFSEVTNALEQLRPDLVGNIVVTMR
ncbi:quinone oxidoreductase-like protein 1 [Amphibalanus amphitrite]|uniref:quinone oxidoreductase-like protein 1 n=1 Tax=Amphibalanus amphitrite TaxID=1232801 RepID=UPI001C9216B1|nr:quinone oxidoreductase-like protein 1 [Amphibalanus amphitrite]XP_043219377.1 quinone oxidoreductase-like protein 1 [Amphibalanus amphitrite]XP_043219383.1 quinone oxidoreductase-like protein 1 [Amphibalanus amphitrite]